MGHHFYGGYSRCFQKSIPGKVSSSNIVFVGYHCVYTSLTCLPFFSQTCPLDLHTDCFYENRKEAIDSRVQLLGVASVETLCDMLEEAWTSQEGKVCSLVGWERFSSLQQAQVFSVVHVNMHSVAILLATLVKLNAVKYSNSEFKVYLNRNSFYLTTCSLLRS